MNDKLAELELLKVLRGACEQARRLGSAAVARVALKYEERYSAQISKLEAEVDRARNS